MDANFISNLNFILSNFRRIFKESVYIPIFGQLIKYGKQPCEKWMQSILKIVPCHESNMLEWNNMAGFEE